MYRTVATFATDQSTGTTGFYIQESTINGPITFTNASGQTLILGNSHMGATVTLDNQGTSQVSGAFADLLEGKLIWDSTNQYGL